MEQNFIEFIQQRVSCPRLSEPAPSEEQLSHVISAALRAPDHMMLRPWRYLKIEGESRDRLGQVFLEASLKDNPQMTDAQRQKCLAMPMRAPMILVAISNNVPHPKVPVVEQQISAGVGVGYALLALRSLGFNGMWRTGALADNAMVKEQLGLKVQESIIGFLYIGTPVGDEKPLPDNSPEHFLKNW